MGSMNADWHRAHVLGSKAAMDERVRWHVAHARECGCRPIPGTVQDVIDRSATSDNQPPR